MGTVYTTGNWKPNPGRETAFVEAWVAFASWASQMPGAGALRLARDLHDPGRFVSFGDWESADEVRDWKNAPEFRERMAQVLQHVGEFQPSELGLLATASDGTTSVEQQTAPGDAATGNGPGLAARAAR